MVQPSPRSLVYKLIVSIAVAGFFYALSPSAEAQTFQTWRDNQGNSSNTNWQASDAWWNFPNPGPIAFGQQEWNNNHQLAQSNSNGGVEFSTWRWLFQAGASASHTFSGDAVRFFDFSTQDPSITNESTATHFINMNISGDGTTEDPFSIYLNNNGGGGLTFNGTVNNQGSNIQILGNASAASTVRFNGIISGSAGFYKENSNITVIFGAANDYSGQLTLQSGTVRLDGAGDTFGAVSQDIRLHSGGVLDLNGVSTSIGSVAEFGTGNGGTITLGSATLTVGGANKGTFYQNSISGSGGVTMSGSGNTTMVLYGNQTYTGTTTVTSGNLSTLNPLSSSAFIISGGSFSTLGASLIGNNASITVNSGTFSLGGNDTVGSISGSGGTINLGANTMISSVAGSSTYSGAITGSGGFTKSGTGTLSLNGTSNYTGGTSVSQGTLRVNGSLGNTAVTVANGATLGGNATIGGLVTLNSGATLAPGNSVGVMDLSSGLTLNSSSTVTMEISNVNGSADRINVTGGTLTYAGNLLFDAESMSGVTNNTYTLFTGSQTGSWNSVALASGPSPGFTNDSGIWTRNAGDGNVWTYNQTAGTLTVIPEPSTYALMGIGAAFVLWRLRRRKQG